MHQLSPFTTTFEDERDPLMHDNVAAHKCKQMTELLTSYDWESLDNHPYSPDMSPRNYDLFPKLKENL